MVGWMYEWGSPKTVLENCGGSITHAGLFSGFQIVHCSGIQTCNLTVQSVHLQDKTFDKMWNESALH